MGRGRTSLSGCISGLCIFLGATIASASVPISNELGLGMKVLGTGWGRGVGWRDVEVARERGEAPAIRLHGQAAIIARRLGMSRWLVTLTHTRTSAFAWVVAERGRVSGSGRPRVARRGAGAGAGARRRPRGRR